MWPCRPTSPSWMVRSCSQVWIGWAQSSRWAAQWPTWCLSPRHAASRTSRTDTSCRPPTPQAWCNFRVPSLPRSLARQFRTRCESAETDPGSGPPSAIRSRRWDTLRSLRRGPRTSSSSALRVVLSQPLLSPPLLLSFSEVSARSSGQLRQIGHDKTPRRLAAGRILMMSNGSS